MSKDGEKKKIKRIFFNFVDTYESKNMAEFLSNCVAGASSEEGEEAEEEEEGGAPKQKEGCWEVYGTLKDQDGLKPKFVKELFNFATREEFYEHVVECDVIVYDINDEPSQIDEAVWLVSALQADVEKLLTPKVFVLVSTVMTWAKSKPLDPEDPEIPFTDEDYRRRKPHPAFKEHCSAEKTVLKCGKALEKAPDAGEGSEGRQDKFKLQTFVVSAGVTFGAGEQLLHYLFKAAWENAPALPLYSGGQNVLPMIHVKDLAQVVQNIADSPPRTRYIVAACDAKNTLEEVTKAVAQHLGNGKVKSVAKEEALIQKDVRQADVETLTTSLRMEAAFIRENMRINWVAESGAIEQMPALVKDFRATRKLFPLRIAVLGPPAVGKSTVAKQLAEHYKLHHIRIKDLIEESIKDLERWAARSANGGAAAAGAEGGAAGGEAEELTEEEEAKMAEAIELLDQVTENMKENNNRLDDSFILRFYKDRLLSPPCQNQGFVLDGFPKNTEQASQLFQQTDEEEEELPEGEKRPPYNAKLMPEFVFAIDAPDEFLRARIMALPEAVVHGTHNTEEGFQRRLNDFRGINTDEDTVLNYFDELEVHPTRFEVQDDKSILMRDTVEKMKKVVGTPRNYGPTEEEKEHARMIEEEKRARKEEEERSLRVKQREEELTERKRRQEEWRTRLEQVKNEELATLELQSQPLRGYLMQHVMPTLSTALMECVKARPDDPVDFLAEYLFHHNPQVN